MVFTNFSLSQPGYSTKLIGMGEIWDLHNVMSFVGLRMSSGSNVLTCEWVCEPLMRGIYSGCELRFSGLKWLKVSRRDDELPLSEDFCVAHVSMLPRSRHLSHEQLAHHESASNEDEQCSLVLHFQSQRDIVIEADSVELVPLTCLALS